ncbi:hypothetical protein CRG98_028258 [Punica granatum]|uniref:Protein kinase domain-containing protein n=1 Tax=Punica granatum TaxID=22663 RepID=A0A2I0J507_PUNGR|nr:hypothetical protein CRG98_028258 [Punica granatum]
MEYRYEELVQSTDQFNKDGFIGNTQFGKVYRGKLESHNSTATSSRKDEVTIKFWRWPQFFTEFCHWVEYESDRLMIKNERLVHEEIRSHPSVAKLIGYCDEEGRDVLIYDLWPLDSVYNLITKDNFGWLHRVKVIIHMALFIEYLHAHNPQYLIRNIDSRHLMLDEVIASSHLTDDRPKELGPWSDIFAFGVLILALICKRAYDPEEEGFYHELQLHILAEEQYERRIERVGRNKRCPKYSKFSLVHKSLLSSTGFSGRDGFTLTKLAMRCVEYSLYDRPSISEVVDSLLKLRTARRHGSDLDIDHLLCLRKQCA